MMSKKCTMLLVTLLCLPLLSSAQDDTKQKNFEIYGFAMMDAGYNFKQIDPLWFDVLRPTKLPTVENQFGTDGNAYFSVRQSRLGVKGWFPTDMGELKTIFEFEMFGVGVDAGQTTIRLRHAYGELGEWARGSTGVLSWISMSSRTASSTGDQAEWCSFGMCRSGGCL